MIQDFFDYLKPTFVMKISRMLLPFLQYLYIVCLSIGLLLIIFVLDPDFQQGENYRILYIHVPFAWMSLSVYLFLTIFSLFYLFTLSPIIHLFSKCLGILGMVFTFLTLVTGSLWGYPMWGTFWVWDARLTSVLILFLVYLGYNYICSYLTLDEARNAYIASIFSIIGVILLPIIKYSVEWWNTLHQGSSITQFNSGIHFSMIYPLFLIFFGFFFYASYVLLLLLRTYLIEKKLSRF
uniref:ABC transporter subunit C n=1 Tax=Jakoba bahamiensis TaxID=221721 RepID=M4Q9M6_9EUKA|nr:ABC transporter subunit C [Jakoba bahamiensis]AGH24122.1 ABC transporter subunit C [Jakoba bahamiensis]